MMYQVYWRYDIQHKGGPFRIVGTLESCKQVFHAVANSQEPSLGYIAIMDLDGQEVEPFVRRAEWRIYGDK